MKTIKLRLTILTAALAFGLNSGLWAQGISLESFSASDVYAADTDPTPEPIAPEGPRLNNVTNSNGVFTYEAAEDGKSANGRLMGVNLMPQFADGATRNQGNVGSCHAFGSMAVMEAAYYRAYGKKQQFSEADIFMRKTVTNGDVYRDFAAGGKPELSEGNNTLENVKFAQENGVATSMQYDAFLKRYQAYRKGEEGTLADIAKQEKEMSWLTRMLYNPRKHWAQLQQNPLSKKIIENYLTGMDPAVKSEREKSKAELKALKIETKSFSYLGSKVHGMNKAARTEASTAQRDFLIGELSAGRPVTVSMSLSGLSGWGQTDTSKHANHAFMIVGFETDANDQPVFKTRNSWGGDNPTISSDELCRIYQAISMKAPGE